MVAKSSIGIRSVKLCGKSKKQLRRESKKFNTTVRQLNLQSAPGRIFRKEKVALRQFSCIIIWCNCVFILPTNLEGGNNKWPMKLRSARTRASTARFAGSNVLARKRVLWLRCVNANIMRSPVSAGRRNQKRRVSASIKRKGFYGGKAGCLLKRN